MADSETPQGRFPSLGDSEQRQNTTALLGEAFLKLGALIAQGAAEAGFAQRPSHSAVFAHIDTDNGSRLTELAARASMAPQSMAEIVDDMIKRGYVERQPDPADRRAKRIVLTERGRGSIHAGLSAIARIEAQLRDLLGEQDLERLRDTLRRIAAARIEA